MSTTYSLVQEAQAAAASEFGRMLRRWRMANGWTQYTAKRWATEAGLHDLVRHSGLSELERAVTRSPRNVVFLSLANLNLLIAEKRFNGVRSRDLMDQLEGSRPIVDDNGVPWGPTEFWACHCGLLPVPDWLAAPAAKPAPALSDEQAAALCAGWAEQARGITMATGAGVAGMLAVGGFAPQRLRKQWQAVAMGLATLTAAELKKLWDPEASEWLPAQWLANWQQSLTATGASSGGGVSSEFALI